MPKPDTQESESTATAPPAGAVSFGKVLGSIQGLQQRLGDFSYADISVAEARVRSLVKQLTAMRDDLANVIHLRQAIAEINQRISSLPQENFELVNLDNLAKHPNLHAIVQVSKLIRLRQQIHEAGPIPSAGLFTAEPRDSSAAASPDQGEVEPAAEKEPANKLTTLDIGGELDEIAVAKPEVEEFNLPKINSAPAALDGSFPVDQGHSSFSAPSFEIPPSEAEQNNVKASDWTFDLNETIAHSSDPAAARVEFDFPAETVNPKQIDSQTTPSTSAVSSKSLTDDKPTVMSPSTNPIQAGDSSPKDDRQPNAVSANTPAKLDLSKALVPAGFDFDQRLLEDVIKTYGDFAITPNLPAIFTDPKPAAPMVAQSKAEPSPELEKSHVAERNYPKVQKAGDLDRQLKKIIKDYGEYDLYSKPSGMNLRTGGIAAFAVLGLVLAGLYFFKSPTPPRGTQTHPAPRPASVSAAPATNAANGAKIADGIAPAQGANAGSSDSSPSVDPK